MRGVVIAIAGALLFCTAASARADAISARSNQLRSASEYKVRVSAALWLAKQRDARAVRALAHALRRDRDHTVRAIAAVSLGGMVDEDTPSDARDDAIDALERAAARDRNARVRKHAVASFERLKALRAPDADALPALFIAVQATDGRVRLRSKATRRALERAVQQSLRRHAPRIAHTASADRLPTRAELERSNTAGFRLSVSISDLSASRGDRGVVVSCAVGFGVNGWEGRDGKERLRENESAAATGRGKVTTGSSKAAITAARRDCVEAVIDQVTAKQIVPFLQRAADRRVARSR